MSLKNKVLLGGWISTAVKVFRREKNRSGENLPGRFQYWMYRECGMKKQLIYNYKNLYKLMIIAPKLMNCILYKTTKFLLIILKKMKNSHVNIVFLTIVKLVSHTLQNRL